MDARCRPAAAGVVVVCCEAVFHARSLPPSHLSPARWEAARGADVTRN